MTLKEQLEAMEEAISAQMDQNLWLQEQAKEKEEKEQEALKKAAEERARKEVEEADMKQRILGLQKQLDELKEVGSSLRKELGQSLNASIPRPERTVQVLTPPVQRQETPPEVIKRQVDEAVKKYAARRLVREELSKGFKCECGKPRFEQNPFCSSCYKAKKAAGTLPAREIPEDEKCPNPFGLKECRKRKYVNEAHGIHGDLCSTCFKKQRGMEVQETPFLEPNPYEGQRSNMTRKQIRALNKGSRKPFKKGKKQKN